MSRRSRAGLGQGLEGGVEESKRYAAVEERAGDPDRRPVPVCSPRRLRPTRDATSSNAPSGSAIRSEPAIRRSGPSGGAGVTGRRRGRAAGDPCAPAWCAGTRCSRDWARSASGTRSTMSRPKPSRPPYLVGLLVMRRMVVTPRSTRIWAPMPYSRLSTGRPSSRLASTVSRPSSWRLVGPELVAEADAPALVAAQVDDHPAAAPADRSQRRLQLRTAVAAQRPEHVAGQALASAPGPGRPRLPATSPMTSARCCSPSSTDS